MGPNDEASQSLITQREREGHELSTDMLVNVVRAAGMPPSKLPEQPPSNDLTRINLPPGSVPRKQYPSSVQDQELPAGRYDSSKSQVPSSVLKKTNETHRRHVPEH
jgi:hypothetical protein